MPRERKGAARKRRTREHIIADLGVHHVEGPVLRCGFTAERIIHDYGLDLYMTTYDADARADRAYWLYVQAHFAARPARAGASQKVTILIPAVNVLDEAAIRRFAAAKAAIQWQTKEVRHE